MTQEEITHLIETKSRIAAELDNASRHLKKKQKEALGIDPRLRQYVMEVARNAARHNLYEIAGVARFLRLLLKYEFDQKSVKRFIRFYEFCHFTGIDGPTQYEVTPVQYYMFAQIFGLQVKASKRKVRVTGKWIEKEVPAHRLTREAVWFVPRKFSKTTTTAALAVYDLLAGDKNSHVFMASNSADQSQICYDEAYTIMENLFPQMKKVRDKEKKLNKHEIVYNDSREGRRSYIKCLSATPRTKEGLNASMVIMDEYAQAKDTASRPGDALKKVLVKSVATRRDPLVITISTASDVIDGPFAQDISHYKKMLIGEEPDDDTIMPVLFCPDVDDNPGDPETWMKCQPHYGVTVTPEYYEAEWAEAQRSSRSMVDFKTKLLNEFCIDEGTQWISQEVAKRALIKQDFWQYIREYGQRYGIPTAFAAVDLSTDGDFTAASVDVFLPAIKQHWIYTKYFFPDGVRVWDSVDPETGTVTRHEELPYDGQIHSKHPNRFLYQNWVNSGHIVLTHGEVVDYQPLVEWLLEIANSGLIDLRAIGYDDWKATEFVNMMVSAQGHGDGLRPIGQTPGEFTTPCMVFKSLICTGQLFMNDNPINVYCFHAILFTDRLGNIKPCKPAENKRIDGLITSLMALKQHIEVGHKARGNDLE